MSENPCGAWVSGFLQSGLKRPASEVNLPKSYNTRKRMTILEASLQIVLIFQGFRGIMQRKSSRFSLLLFSPFSLVFWEHQKHNLIRRCIEVVITAPTRNRVNRRKTGPWVRIPPPPPHQFPCGNPLGSWFFIGSRSALLSGHSPLHLPRTVWSCSPDGHKHWLWSRNRCGQATPGSAS